MFPLLDFKMNVIKLKSMQFSSKIKLVHIYESHSYFVIVLFNKAWVRLASWSPGSDICGDLNFRILSVCDLEQEKRVCNHTFDFILFRVLLEWRNGSKIYVVVLTYFDSHIIKNQYIHSLYLIQILNYLLFRLSQYTIIGNSTNISLKLKPIKVLFYVRFVIMIL